jgi:hypothetical protein
MKAQAARFSLLVVLLSLALGVGATSPAPDDFSCADVTEIPQVECEALVELYTSTDGANWADNTGWLDTNTPCSWYGVGCSLGHVDAISLGYNQLSGSVPPELGNLANLGFLLLGDNQLSGNIPPELGDLANLQHLDLGYNQLSGSITPALGNLTNLSFLSLSTNQLSESIPPELGNLANLYYLDLYYSQLSGSIPPELGNLANLGFLLLGDNQLSGALPHSLMNLSQLYSFWFDMTDLCEPPDADFQDWLASIPDLRSTGVICDVMADFSGAPTSGLAPLTVAFTNTSTGDYDTSLWLFGDGSTSTLPNPVHIYPASGTYSVALTVSGAGGNNTEVRAGYITVHYGVYLPVLLRGS